jgi:DNA-binding GntR family transcriptional regulator
LQELGLISRRRGIGTVVTASAAPGAYVQRSRLTWRTIALSGEQPTRGASPRRRRADAELAAALGCGRGTRWLAHQRLATLAAERHGNRLVYIYSTPRHRTVAPLVGRSAERVFELVERKFGTRASRVEVEIRAGVLDAARAAALGVVAGGPSLIVLRRYRDAEGALFSDHAHRTSGGAIHLRIRSQPDGRRLGFETGARSK